MSVDTNPRVDPLSPNFKAQINDILRAHAQVIRHLGRYAPSAEQNSARRYEFTALPAAGAYRGEYKWNESLGAPAWWNGAAWVDATGTPV